jgi:hypothetical protein
MGHPVDGSDRSREIGTRAHFSEGSAFGERRLSSSVTLAEMKTRGRLPRNQLSATGRAISSRMA